MGTAGLARGATGLLVGSRCCCPTSMLQGLPGSLSDRWRRRGAGGGLRICDTESGVIGDRNAAKFRSASTRIPALEDGNIRDNMFYTEHSFARSLLDLFWICNRGGAETLVPNVWMFPGDDWQDVRREASG